jgi:hypothetical protein
MAFNRPGMKKVVGKYLLGHAEPQIEALSGLPQSVRYEQVLVIPACNESADFLQRLPPSGGRKLLVLVINQDANAAPSVRATNEALASAARSSADTIWVAGEQTKMELLRSSDQPWDFLLLDCFSPGRELPIDGGVGQARKLGADLALTLIDRGQINSPWIHNTDADTELPATYFRSGQDQCQDAAAVLFPFQHRCNRETEVGRATLLYEFSLRYYVAALDWSGSPYAFQTVGSSFAVHAARYAQVRGFPKRAAAEDFYMLNKLAKVADIVDLDCAPIIIHARTSDRVPFGTGAAVAQMLNMQDAFKEYTFYDPRVFACLRASLATLEILWELGSVSSTSLVQGIQSLDPPPLPAEQLADALCSLGLLRALEHGFRQSANLQQFERQMHAWFDAFRTLKLIHHLRDEYFPSVPLAQLGSKPIYQQIATHNEGLILKNPG